METEKSLRAAIYCRQSSGSEKESYSLEDQIAKGRKRANEKGYQIVAEYVDYNISGWAYPDTIEARKFAVIDKAAIKACKDSTRKESKYYRPELGKLFENLKNIDIVVAYGQDRLYRSYPNSNLENYIRIKLVENNIKCDFVQEGLKDFTDNMTLLISSIQNQVKMIDVINKSIASRESMLLRKEKGFVNLSKLIGYKIGNGEALQLPKAKHLKTAMEMFIKGESKNAIVRFLRDNEYPKIEINQLSAILKNPLYAGYTLINGDLLPAKQMQKNELITLDFWKKLQIKIKQYQKPSPQRIRDYIHTGLCFCGYCGGRMVPYNNQGLIYLVCADYLNHKYRYKDGIDTPCKHNSIRVFDNKKGTQLNTLLKGVAFGYFAVSKINEEKNKEIKSKIEVLQYDLEKIDIQIKLKEQEIIDNVLDSVIVKSCNNILRGYTIKYKTIKNEISELSDKIKDKIEQVDLHKTELELNALPPQEINAILRKMLNKVIIYSDKVVIDYPHIITTVERVKANNRQTVINDEDDWVSVGKD